MALGNPFLVTYAEDDLLRSYEYVTDVFVPIGVSAAYPHVPPATAIGVGNVDPQFEWVNDDTYLFFMYAISANQNGYVAFDPAMNVVDTLAGGSATDAAGGYLAYVNDIDSTLQRYASNLHANSVFYTVDNVGDIGNGPLPIFVGYDTNTDLSVSPNGNIFTVCAKTGNARLMKRTSFPGIRPPTFSDAVDVIMLFQPEIIRWAGDNATAIALSRNDRIGQVYNYDGTTFTKVQDLQLYADVGAAILHAEMSPDGRVLAVSFVNGSTYTTKLYRRTSGFMLPLQELIGFGKDLTFSADGKILVDAALLRAVIMDDATGTFIDHDSAMANVAPDIRISKMSLAPTDKVANPLVYIAALEPFATCGIDYDNLKYTLLTDAAAFDETDTDMGQVTNSGAWEVSEAAWPAGGLLLANVTEGMGVSTYEFKCDPLTWLTFGETMSWRYGVLYDATNDIPLVCFDYYGERIVAANRQVNFDFPGEVFLRLTR